jgi:predicted nicotinamide N-methyase
MSVVLDLPQLYTKPAASTLLSTLDDLSVQPLSWEATPRPKNGKDQLPRKRKINNEGVPQYLTKIIASPLAWIEDDNEKEQVWEAASQRMSERSGRTAMGAITRSFAIPLSPVVEVEQAVGVVQPEQASGRVLDDIVELTIHEPPMTADNLGLKTWASSYLLAKQLCSLRRHIPDLPSDAVVLELGAGTGLVGMAASAVFQRDVLLTDLPEIVPNLEQNARSNESAISYCHGTVSAAVLDWMKPDELQADACNGLPNSFPLIVIADPIYSPEHPRLLVNAIEWHLSRDDTARVVIELPLRDAYVAERQDLRDRLASIGLGVVEQGEEVGYDDWSSGDGEELTEVRCWWSVWGRQ